MPVFRGGLNLDFGSIISGLRNIGRAAASITRISIPAPKGMPTLGIKPILADANKVIQLMNKLSAVPRVRAPAMGKVLGGDIMGKMGPSAQKDVGGLFAGIRKAAYQFGAGGISAKMPALIKALDQYKVLTEKTAETLRIYKLQLAREVSTSKRITETKRRLGEEQARLQEQIRNQVRQLRTTVTQKTWGRMPVIGGIMGAFGQYRAQRAEMQGMFGALAQAGAPVGKMTQMVSTLTLAAGPIGVIAKTAKEAVGFFVRLGSATIRFGISLARLPLNIFSWLHRSLRSLAFSFLMFGHMFQRFFKDAFGFMKNLHVATLVASGTFKGLNENIAFAVKVGSKYAISLSEISQGFVQVAKAGYDAAEQQQIVNAAVQGATSLQANLGKTIDVTLTILKAWDMQAERSVEVVGVLRTAVETTKSTWEGMATALGYGAAASASLNANFVDSVAIMAQFMDKGLRASRAGMAFRTMIAGMDKAIGRATQGQMDLDRALEIIGVDWQKYADQMRDGSMDIIAVVEDLSKVTEDGISAQERLALLQVFGRRYYSQIILLLKDADGALSDFNDTLRQNVKLQERAAEMSSSLIGVIIILKNIWLTFKIYVLEGMRTPLESISKGLEHLAGVAEAAGLAVGELIETVFLAPAVDWLSEMLSVENIKEFTAEIQSVIKQIGGWFERIKAAGINWIKTVSKDAYEGSRNFVDVIGALMETAINVSAEITASFLEILGKKDVIINIINQIAYLVTEILPPVIGLILSVIERILSLIKTLSFGLIDTDDLLIEIEKIRAAARGIGDDYEKGLRGANDLTEDLFDKWKDQENLVESLQRKLVELGPEPTTHLETVMEAGEYGIFTPGARGAERRRTQSELEKQSKSLEEIARIFNIIIDRQPEVDIANAAAAKNRE